MTFIKKLVRGEEGISSVEYGLLLALITAAIALAATNLGTAVTGAITNATAQF